MLTQEEILRIRAIAREEVASLLGLILRRVQGFEECAEAGDIDLEDPELAHELAAGEPILRRDLASIVGEALRDYGATSTEPGT